MAKLACPAVTEAAAKTGRVGNLSTHSAARPEVSVLVSRWSNEGLLDLAARRCRRHGPNFRENFFRPSVHFWGPTQRPAWAGQSFARPSTPPVAHDADRTPHPTLSQRFCDNGGPYRCGTMSPMSRKRHIPAENAPSAHAHNLEHQRPASGPAQSPSRAAELLPARAPREHTFDAALRPRSFEEYIGQGRVVENLKVFVEAAHRRQEALDHVLFCGPPGLGKTTLAHLIASALGVTLRPVGAPAIEHKGTLASYLTSLNERDVLFIDEIHRLQPIVEEYLYPAMEDYRIEIPIGDGPSAQLIHMSLPRFTLVGATTRTGLLTSPLRDRFGIVLRLDYYTPSELAEIVRRSALRLSVPITERACQIIGQRSRGTPRIANRLLRRVRDFAEVEHHTTIDIPHCGLWLDRLGVDALGLDEMDRALLRSVIERFDGGPVGIESLAAAVAEEADTLEDVYEPYLIQTGFLSRTPRGRVATRMAYEHLGIQLPVSGSTMQLPQVGQPRLF